MKKYIWLILLITISIKGQNLDSLYNLLISRNISVKGTTTPTTIAGHQNDKCGFSLYGNIKSHFHEYSKEQQESIAKITQRAPLQKSTVSPSGYFRIHYDTTGTNKPQYDNLDIETGIYELAVAFDSAYTFEIDILGYGSPPSDNGIGGDDKYDIYVKNLNPGLYGQTFWEEKISYIEIDNSFNENEGYNSYGIQAARATAAHEFHHAIQVGAYIFKGEDTYYYELTSTAFEEFVYDDVNDYYAYMSSFLRNTSNRFDSNTGYNLAVWNIFLNERFKSVDVMEGHNIVKRSWELMRDKNYRAIVAIANSVQEFGHSFSKTFNEFGDWLYFTNNNAVDGMYFEEAASYPSIRSTYTIELNSSESSLNIQAEPTSLNYLQYSDNTGGDANLVMAVISNSGINASTIIENPVDINVSLANFGFDDSKSINDTYYSKITTESNGLVNDSYIINNIVYSEDLNPVTIDFVYPQPFRYDIYSIVNIPTYADVTNTAELKIYSSDMDLIYSGKKTIFANDNIVVGWDGLDNSGRKLASGVYIYITQANNKIKKGKLVIFN